MIQEDYVTFEQAKALKELGFPQDEYQFQYKENGEIENGFTDLCLGYITCPSLSIVQKWLREEKNYIIESIYNYSRKFVYCIYINGDPDKMSFNLYHYNTYEQALSAGIDKCIDLLKNNE